MSADDKKTGTPRQAIIKQPGRARRARLEPAPNTDPHPETPIAREEGGVASVGKGVPGARGENDDRLKRDRPPHW